MKRLLPFVLVLLLGLPLLAQESRRELAANPELAAGYLYPYVPGNTADTPAPKGYEPVYISHYGRHGSRYHLAHILERYLPTELEEAHAAGMLTPEGEEALQAARQIVALHDGMAEELSQLGMRQHEEIASRMVARFPGVFADSTHVRCISTKIPRCIMSMTAFTGRLISLRPTLVVSYDTGTRYTTLLAHSYPHREDINQILADLDSSQRRHLHYDRLVSALFQPGYEVRNPRRLAQSLYHLGAVSYGIEAGVDLFRFLSPEELFQEFQLYNDNIYGSMGNSAQTGRWTTSAAVGLLESVIEQADAALAVGGTSADLRFGHDSGILPLVGLMRVDGFDRCFPAEKSEHFWLSYKTVPPASNLQMVFYRNAAGKVLVKLLYNEQETSVPEVKPFRGPYYRWDDLRSYWTELIKKTEL